MDNNNDDFIDEYKHLGWIKLHRRIVYSPVFANPTALKIWLWFLCKASHRGRTIPLKIGKGIRSVSLKSGEFIFGRNKAEDELGIDGRTVYDYLKKFQSDSMIKVKTNKQYSIVTVLKYNDFQVSDDAESNKQPTTNQQATNNTPTTNQPPTNTNKNVNNVDNDNKTTSVGVTPPAPPQTVDDRKKEFANQLIPYVDTYGKEMIRQFYDYWTEKSPTHKKMKFEKEKAFEVDKRLSYWKTMNGKFENKKQRSNPNNYQAGKFVA